MDSWYRNQNGREENVRWTLLKYNNTTFTFYIKIDSAIHDTHTHIGKDTNTHTHTNTLEWMCTHIPLITHTYTPTHTHTHTLIHIHAHSLDTVVLTVTYNAGVEFCNKYRSLTRCVHIYFPLPCVGCFIDVKYTPSVALDRLYARSYSLSCIVWITKTNIYTLTYRT